VIVGDVQFSRAWIGDSHLVVLGPMGVRPDHQGRGIGSELIHRGLDEARGRGEPAVVLLGTRIGQDLSSPGRPHAPARGASLGRPASRRTRRG
jgi:GNAT superfamily N-acetyltransferase